MHQTRYLEDLSEGDQFTTAHSATVSQDMIEAYFRITNDRFDVHSDRLYALALGLRDVMVPGNLVTAIGTGLAYSAGYFTHSLYVQARKSVSFVSPLYVGDSVYVKDVITFVDRTDTAIYGRVFVDRRILNTNNELIQAIDQEYRILRRDWRQHNSRQR